VLVDDERLAQLLVMLEEQGRWWTAHWLDCQALLGEK